VREVVIPLGNGASTLSAYGIAAGDVTRFVEAEVALRAPFDDTALSREIAAIIGRARQSMVAVGEDGEQRIDAWALMRYQEQLMHGLEVLIDPADCDVSAGVSEGLADRLAEHFTREYARRYGASAAAAFQAAEIFALRVRARVPAASIMPGGPAATPATSSPPGRTVPVFWPDTGQRLDTRVYDGSQLADGAQLAGPALAELSHTTIAVPDGASLTAAGGHFRLRLPAPAPARQAPVKGAAR
jgi:N-methylhydantoinase A